MDKEIKIWNNRLKITKHESGLRINDKNANLFIHANSFEFEVKRSAWLRLFSASGSHIGSIWINTDTDIQKIKELLGEVA